MHGVISAVDDVAGGVQLVIDIAYQAEHATKAGVRCRRHHPLRALS